MDAMQARPPVRKIRRTPTFLAVESCRARIAGMGRIRTYQSKMMLTMPRGGVNFAKYSTCQDVIHWTNDSPGQGLTKIMRMREKVK